MHLVVVFFRVVVLEQVDFCVWEVDRRGGAGGWYLVGCFVCWYLVLY